MSAETHEVHSSSDYIKHHLQNLTYGKKPDGEWGLAHTAQEAKDMGFWSLNVDSLGVSIVLGVLFLWAFRRVAKRANAGVPSGWQNFVEWVIEFIDNSVRGSFSGKNPMVAPLAMTVFIWIFLMNFMDLFAVSSTTSALRISDTLEFITACILPVWKLSASSRPRFR